MRKPGMNKSIKRRDFLNGAAIAIAAGSTLPARTLFASVSEAAEQLLAEPEPDGLAKDYYPPTLTGIRGSHNGSFEVAHESGTGIRSLHESPPSTLRL